MHADPYPGYYQAYAMPAELVEGEIALTAWGGAAEKYHSGDYEGAATAFQEVLEVVRFDVQKYMILKLKIAADPSKNSITKYWNMFRRFYMNFR